MNKYGTPKNIAEYKIRQVNVKKEKLSEFLRLDDTFENPEISAIVKKAAQFLEVNRTTISRNEAYMTLIKNALDEKFSTNGFDRKDIDNLRQQVLELKTQLHNRSSEIMALKAIMSQSNLSVVQTARHNESAPYKLHALFCAFSDLLAYLDTEVGIRFLPTQNALFDIHSKTNIYCSVEGLKVLAELLKKQQSANV